MSDKWLKCLQEKNNPELEDKILGGNILLSTSLHLRTTELSTVFVIEVYSTYANNSWCGDCQLSPLIFF